MTRHADDYDKRLAAMHAAGHLLIARYLGVRTCGARLYRVDVANPVSLVVSGTEGHAYILNGKLFYQSQHVDGADGTSEWTQLPAAWPHAFHLFLDALTGQSDVSLVTAQEAALRSAVMEALYQGAADHTWVTPVQG